MANYSLVANTQFKAKSFEDLIKPYVMYTQEYRAQEDALSELATKADVWQGLANEQTDPIAYAQYTNYANALKDQAAMIADRGLDPSSRQAMLNLKRRYTSEITPIEQAYQLRKTLTDEQRKAMLADNSLIFSKDYSTASLDELLNNPNATYRAISGNELTKRSAAMASALAKTIQQNPDYKGIMEGQYIQSLQQIGYTPEQIINTIISDPTAPEELKKIIDTVYNDSGLANFDVESQARGRQFINQGLYNAIGTQKYDVMQDRSYISPAEERRLKMEKDRIKLAEDELAWKKGQTSDTVTDANGITYKKLPGGNILVTGKDGKSVVVNSSGEPIMEDLSLNETNTSNSVEQRKSFTPFFMKGWGDNSIMNISETSDGYSDEGIGKNEVWQTDVTEAGQTIKGKDGVERNTFILGADARAQIKSALQKYNVSNKGAKFTLDDVVVLRDQDAVTDNHYKVILKGMKENGEIIQDDKGNLDLDYWGISSNLKDPGL